MKGLGNALGRDSSFPALMEVTKAWRWGAMLASDTALRTSS